MNKKKTVPRKLVVELPDKCFKQLDELKKNNGLSKKFAVAQAIDNFFNNFNQKNK